MTSEQRPKVCEVLEVLNKDVLGELLVVDAEVGLTEHKVAEYLHREVESSAILDLITHTPCL